MSHGKKKWSDSYYCLKVTVVRDMAEIRVGPACLCCCHSRSNSSCQKLTLLPASPHQKKHQQTSTDVSTTFSYGSPLADRSAQLSQLPCHSDLSSCARTAEVLVGDCSLTLQVPFQDFTSYNTFLILKYS